MNNQTIIKILAAIFTVCLLIAVSSMFYIYIKDPMVFKWAIGVSVAIIVPIILYSIFQSFFEDLVAKKIEPVQEPEVIKHDPKHNSIITYQMDESLQKNSVVQPVQVQEKEDKWW